MAAFDKMTIWEVNNRLEMLYEFRNLFVNYYNNVESVSFLQVQPNEEGIQSRHKINKNLDRIRECMYLSGYNTEIIYTDAPAIGGRRQIFSLLENMFELSRYQIDPNMLLDQIEQAIGKYENNRIKSIKRTLNPFFWLNEIIAFVIGLPFRLLISARLIDESTMETSRFFAAVKSIFVFLGMLITYTAGFLGIADKLGYLNSIKDWIDRIF